MNEKVSGATKPIIPLPQLFFKGTLLFIPTALTIYFAWKTIRDSYIPEDERNPKIAKSS